MSLVSYTELVRLAQDGVLTNVNPAHINGSSIDITLGEDVLVEMPVDRERVAPLSLTHRESPAMYRVHMNKDTGYVLSPGEFILTHSFETFNLPLDISCEFKLKSSLARMGINQLTACWCDPGWTGSVITLELQNVLRYHQVRVRPGDKVGQIVFFRHAPVPLQHSYLQRGRYNGDKSVSGIKL